VDLGTLADAVVNLVRHSWPPSMLLVYDEVGGTGVAVASPLDKAAAEAAAAEAVAVAAQSAPAVGWQ
jgi:hypothetical protein